MSGQCHERGRTALLVVDVQEKLFNLVERRSDTLRAIKKIVRGAQILGVPILVSEQYPQGLGATEPQLRESLGSDQQYLSKTTFSVMADPTIRKIVEDCDKEQWIVVGIEAHVCILQTVRDLLAAGKQVTVLNDAISSRSIYDYSTAIAELRDLGARISSVETMLFELVHDSKAPEFKQISDLVKCS